MKQLHYAMLKLDIFLKNIGDMVKCYAIDKERLYNNYY